MCRSTLVCSVHPASLLTSIWSARNATLNALHAPTCQATAPRAKISMLFSIFNQANALPLVQMASLQINKAELVLIASQDVPHARESNHVCHARLVYSCTKGTALQSVRLGWFQVQTRERVFRASHRAKNVSTQLTSAQAVTPLQICPICTDLHAWKGVQTNTLPVSPMDIRACLSPKMWSLLFFYSFVSSPAWSLELLKLLNQSCTTKIPLSAL